MMLQVFEGTGTNVRTANDSEYEENPASDMEAIWAMLVNDGAAAGTHLVDRHSDKLGYR